MSCRPCPSRRVEATRRKQRAKLKGNRRCKTRLQPAAEQRAPPLSPSFFATARDPAETRSIIHKIRVLERPFLQGLNIQRARSPPPPLVRRGPARRRPTNQPCRHPGQRLSAPLLRPHPPRPCSQSFPTESRMIRQRILWNFRCLRSRRCSVVKRNQFSGTPLPRAPRPHEIARCIGSFLGCSVAAPRRAVTTHDPGTRYHGGIQGDSRTATGNFFILTLRLQRQRYWLTVRSLLATFWLTLSRHDLIFRCLEISGLLGSEFCADLWSSVASRLAL